MSSVNSVSTSSSTNIQKYTSSLSNSLTVSSSTSSATTSYNRCQGLDLLLQAVYYVDKSFSTFPFVRKRVLIRRRRRSAAAYAFSDFVLNELFIRGRSGLSESEVGKRRIGGDPVTKGRSKRRAMAVPMKYRDSVIETWKSDRV